MPADLRRGGSKPCMATSRRPRSYAQCGNGLPRVKPSIKHKHLLPEEGRREAGGADLFIGNTAFWIAVFRDINNSSRRKSAVMANTPGPAVALKVRESAPSTKLAFNLTEIHALIITAGKKKHLTHGCQMKPLFRRKNHVTPRAHLVSDELFF